MNLFSLSSKLDLSLFIEKENFKKIFIICGKKSFDLSGAKKIFFSVLKNKNTKYYFKKSPYPEIFELKKIIFLIKEFSPDLIIAVGGGSVIDYGKIANVLEIEENLNKSIENSNYKIRKKFSKLLAIPTTAGSGAEVTENAVIYINKIKYSIEGKEVKPDYFFLIPELIIGASKKIKSSAGFDSIAQSIESLFSKKSTKESVDFAKNSLKISLKYYLDFVKKPNIENTSAMSIAAHLSGKAINISKTTAPHAVSYPFTALYNISHGHAVSLTLNQFIKFNYENIKKANCNFSLKERYKLLFKLTNSKNLKNLDEYLIGIKKKSGLENNFKKLGINIKENYNEIISGINILRLSNNPVEIEKSDIQNILFKHK
tara:strand:- start:2544 stop:3659 length:1116 start_codon:yes stop_codon:yes gene_type:complete